MMRVAEMVLWVEVLPERVPEGPDVAGRWIASRMIVANHRRTVSLRTERNR